MVTNLNCLFTKMRILFTVIVLIGIGILPCQALPDKEKAKEKAIVINQTATDFGHIELIIGESGCRMIFMRGSCSFVARSPNWNVVGYNINDKRGRFVPGNLWVTQGPVLFGEFGLNFTKVKGKPMPEPKMGLSLSVATVPARYASLGASGVFRSNRKDELVPKTITYKAIDKLKLPQAQRDFLRGLYRSPTIGEVPFEISLTATNGKIQKLLQTDSFKRVQVLKSTFDCVPSFKQAPTMEALMWGNQFESMMEDMIGPPGRTK